MTTSNTNTLLPKGTLPPQSALHPQTARSCADAQGFLVYLATSLALVACFATAAFASVEPAGRLTTIHSLTTPSPTCRPGQATRGECRIGLRPTVRTAAGGISPAVYTIDEVTRGSLLLPTSTDGKFLAAPRVGSKVVINISGTVARTVVTQRFYNPSDEWVEAVYVFPLPDKAAVDGMRVRVGDRFIEGKLKLKQVAIKQYTEAKSAGKVASLVIQQRPNRFTNRVANIGPGQEVAVEIEYQQVLDYSNESWRLDFPMLAVPNEAGTNSADRESDTDPLELEINIDAGLPLSSIKSPSHKIKVARLGGHLRQVTLADGSTAANRDFVLNWKPRVGKEPLAALLNETNGDQAWQLLMVVPPYADQPSSSNKRQAERDIIFVVDTSSSMAGKSMSQAKKALDLALQRLAPGTSFNIIRFDSVTETMLDAPVFASEQAVSDARQWVSNLHARGGTDMLPALEAALAQAAPVDRLRQLVFITDGAVSNGDLLLKLIHDHLDDTRLFTVGIGSAPNSLFMRKAAEFGRGSFLPIAGPSEVATQMEALFKRLESPVLTDIELDFGGVPAVAWPDRVPDLYTGQPVVVLVRVDGAGGQARVSGTLDGKPWSTTVTADLARQESGLARLWARHKIESLTDRMSLLDWKDDSGRKQLADAGTRTALRYNLLSQWTALVAVDDTPARVAGQALKKHLLAVDLPAGWKNRAFVTRPLRSFLPWTEQAVELLQTSTSQASTSASGGDSVRLASLPQTASGALGMLLAGLLLLASGLLLSGGLLQRREDA